MPTTTGATEYGDVAALAAIVDRMVSVEDWQVSDDRALAEMDALGVVAERIGVVTTDRAQAMVTGLKHLPDEVTQEQVTAVQDSLVAEADELHPNDLRLLANRAVAILFPEVEEDRLGKLLEREERRAQRDRHLAFGRNSSGSVTFKRQLSPLDGEKFITLITPYAQQLKNKGEDLLDPLTESPTTAQLQADALVAMFEDLFTQQAAPTSGGDPPRTRSPRPRLRAPAVRDIPTTG